MSGTLSVGHWCHKGKLNLGSLDSSVEMAIRPLAHTGSLAALAVLLILRWQRRAFWEDLDLLAIWAETEAMHYELAKQGKLVVEKTSDLLLVAMAMATGILGRRFSCRCTWG